MAELGKLPGWVRSVLGEPNERWCGLCGLPEGHRVHARGVPRGEVVDVADAKESALLGVPQLECHRQIDESAGPSDGREPKHGEMRLPGWRVLRSFLGVPLLEGYRQDRSVDADFVFVWREPRTARWRWGAVTVEMIAFSVRSATWLHDALAGARSEFAEVFAPRGS
jgi:hypothetical protein